MEFSRFDLTTLRIKASRKRDVSLLELHNESISCLIFVLQFLRDLPNVEYEKRSLPGRSHGNICRIGEISNSTTTGQWGKSGCKNGIIDELDFFFFNGFRVIRTGKPACSTESPTRLKDPLFGRTRSSTKNGW